MSDNLFEKEKKDFTPERGFNLVGIDYFGDPDGQLYLIEHFDLYQDALGAKKKSKKSSRVFYFVQRFRWRIFISLNYKKYHNFILFYKLFYHKVNWLVICEK